MEILKYIEKEKRKIEKQKESKEKRIEDLKIKIKKLEKKVNTETEKESVIVRSEAKIKVFKNRIKVIELESIDELDKEYIKEAADKNIEELSSDLIIKNKKILGKIYYLFSELVENIEEAKESHAKLRRSLDINGIQGYYKNQFEQGGRLRDLRTGGLNVTKDNISVSLEKNLGFGTMQNLTIYKKDFE